ncbi:hypothetical protein JR316_0012196 [Psilocybe cubensis]|uniref:Uncharacterized protein n=2 Tax=Psilocybe cubensis TaxID=181762 RepID=A0ACB8GHK4_PSICU|nr:hypothetical protein JR316_0012196 [Psilocybe cubensis]KAH9475089.1 hypothetical protein JR316_0012196 [Psilocybe cubensis]
MSSPLHPPAQQHGITTTILDLPNELVLHILSIDDVLSSKDLFNVSFLSRRLHAIAMPLFLSNHGVMDPAHETSIFVIEWDPNRKAITYQPDALSGLSTLTSLSSIENFKCFFQDPDSKTFRNTRQDAFHLPDAVNRVSRFIQRLKNVGNAEIYLMWDPYFVTHARSMVNTPITETKRWANAFGYLLNLLVLRGCKSLTVQYDPTISPPFTFQSTNRLKRAWSFVSQNVFRRDGQSPSTGDIQLQWEFKRPLYEEKWENAPTEKVESPLLASLGQRFNCITHLAIHSPTLLLPPFTNWTLSLLRTHPLLTSISFAYITFSKDTWATILPFIVDAVADKLTELAFYKNCPEIDVDNLLLFISHLPNLRRLTVDRSFRSRLNDARPYKARAPFLTSPAASLPAFLHLETLHAPVELVSLLLDYQPAMTKGGTALVLPRLTNLAVYPSSRLIHPPSYIKSSLVVNALLQRMVLQTRSLPIVYALDAQMEFTDFGPVSQYINALNTRQEFRRVVWETLSEADIDTLMQNGNNNSNSNIPLIAFVHITHLFLYRIDAPSESALRSLEKEQKAPPLCVWINLLFPNLECIEFTCHMEANPRQQQHMDEKTIEWLVSALTDACPKVRMLIVGKKVYNLNRS